MTKEEKIKMLGRIKEQHNKIEGLKDKLDSVFGCIPECKLYSVLYEVHEDLVKLTAEKLNDVDNWLEWFAYENAWGKNNLEAQIKVDGTTHFELRFIKTIEDVLKLIEISEKLNKRSD